MMKSGLVFVSCFVAGLAATELTLASFDGAEPVRHVFGIGRRVAPLHEWVPSSVMIATPPATRRANPGPILAEQYQIDVDEDGFIRPSVVHATADRTVVFLGGSTTECLYVEPENRFPYLTGRELERRTGLRVNTLNGARSGNDAVHNLHLLMTKVLPRRPDVVVLMNGINDLGHLSRDNGYWARSAAQPLVERSNTTLAAALGELRTALIPHTWLAVRRVGAIVRRMMGTEAEAAELLDPKTLGQWEGDFRSALVSFVQVARAWHIKPVLMTEVLSGAAPFRLRTGDGGYLDPARLGRQSLSVETVVDMHTRFNDVIRSVAAEYGVPLIDLAHLVPADGTTVYDGMHFHDGGSRLVAETISGALVPLIER
ncbi:MAG: SGNH/GDSL hydrolase family protein [Alphaproteobacteria bacterium]|nr:SGNH/GDSL hydrolase family protein [Alphaproteobacteria bacterium]